jgi:hypothetical protein
MYGRSHLEASYQSRMRGTFKSGPVKNKDLMMQLGKLVPILLLFGTWFISGLVTAAELTADQQVQPSTAAVGETAMVTIMLSYSGNNGTQVTVTPGFTPGVLVGSGSQTELLYPGSLQMISYPIRAEWRGSYWISSLISYTDDGAVRQLSKESSFTATGGPSQPEQPGGAPGPSQPAHPSLVNASPSGVESSPTSTSSRAVTSSRTVTSSRVTDR